MTKKKNKTKKNKKWWWWWCWYYNMYHYIYINVCWVPVCICVRVCLRASVDVFYLGVPDLFCSFSSSESSNHDSCTICCTLFSYSRLFSRNNWAASLFAGLFGFGSCNNDLTSRSTQSIRLCVIFELLVSREFVVVFVVVVAVVVVVSAVVYGCVLIWNL